MIYRIQNITYSAESLKAACDRMISSADVRDWEKLIWSFIQEFIDDSKDYFVVKTSGSTGAAKELKILKRYAIASAEKTVSFFNLKPDATAHLCMNANYIGAKMMIVRALAGSLHLTYSEPTADALSKIYHDVDFCACVPIQLRDLVEKLPLGNRHIKTLIIGGGVLDSKLKMRLISQHTNYYQTFGMTETISHIALLPINGEDQFYTVLSGVRISQDADSNCLIIDAPDIGITGLLSNDLIHYVSETQFEWLGRVDDIINSGGIKINPIELEAKIVGLIEQPFFIGSRPDDLLGNKLILLIQTEDSNITQMVAQQFKTVLTKYELPKEIYCLPKFVYTDTQKINRLQTLKLLHL